MTIFVASEKAELIPKFENGEKVHVIASKCSMVPITFFDNQLDIKLHLIDNKKPDIIDIALKIGGIVKDCQDDTIRVICPNESMIKAFNDSVLDGENGMKVKLAAELISDKVRPKRSRAKKASNEQIEEKPEIPVKRSTHNERRNIAVKTVKQSSGKRKNLKQEDKIKALMDAGIGAELCDAVISAIEESSDPEIGFDIQLKTKLAAIDQTVDYNRIKDISLRLYNKLK